MGLLDPATLQPLNKVAAMPALDAAGRGMKIEKAADGLRTVIAQGITVEDTPCVLLLGMPLPPQPAGRRRGGCLHPRAEPDGG